MPTKEKPVLTSAQRKVLKEAGASVDQAYAAARRAVLAAGIQRGDEGEGTACLLAPRGHCRSFQPPRRGVSIRCARPGCGHSFTKHDVF